MMLDDREIGYESAQAAHFLARHFGQGFSVAANREQKDYEVLHAAAENSADQNPERARQISELGCQHRTDQRPWAGDGGEVMSEHHPFVGGDEVAAIVQALARRGPLAVQRQHFGGDELAVETIAQRIGAKRRHHQPHGIDLLAAMQGDRGQRQRAQHATPHQVRVRRSLIIRFGLRSDSDPTFRRREIMALSAIPVWRAVSVLGGLNRASRR